MQSHQFQKLVIYETARFLAGNPIVINNYIQAAEIKGGYFKRTKSYTRVYSNNLLKIMGGGSSKWAIEEEANLKLKQAENQRELTTKIQVDVFPYKFY